MMVPDELKKRTAGRLSSRIRPVAALKIALPGMHTTPGVVVGVDSRSALPPCTKSMKNEVAKIRTALSQDFEPRSQPISSFRVRVRTRLNEILVLTLA